MSTGAAFLSSEAPAGESAGESETALLTSFFSFFVGADILNRRERGRERRARVSDRNGGIQLNDR